MAEFKVGDIVVMVDASGLEESKKYLGIPCKVFNIIDDCLCINPDDLTAGWYTRRFIKSTGLSQLEKIIYNIP